MDIYSFVFQLVAHFIYYKYYFMIFDHVTSVLICSYLLNKPHILICYDIRSELLLLKDQVNSRQALQDQMVNYEKELQAV